MKITINRKVLLDALGSVAPFANKKTAIAILKNIKIVTKGNRIKFETSDTKVTSRCYVEAVEIDQDGEFLVDAEVFLKYIEKITDENIVMAIENNTLTIKHAKGKAEIQTEPTEEFPVFEMPNDNTTEISLFTSLLSEYIGVAKGFVGTDDLRPQLSAIYAYIKSGEFGCCATDTRVLFHDHKPIEIGEEIDINWYIEPSVFNAIIKACRNADIATIKVCPTTVSYRIGNTIIQTVQTKGNYPQFERVIPKDWNMECTVYKKDLLDSIQRVGMFCDNTRCLKIAVNPLDMVISADNIEMLRKSFETIQHNGCGGDLTIGLQADYLATCLSACGEEVVLRFGGETRPVLFGNTDNPSSVVLCMPLVLNY